MFVSSSECHHIVLQLTIKHSIKSDNLNKSQLKIKWQFLADYHCKTSIVFDTVINIMSNDDNLLNNSNGSDNSQFYFVALEVKNTHTHTHTLTHTQHTHTQYILCFFFVCSTKKKTENHAKKQRIRRKLCIKQTCIHTQKKTETQRRMTEKKIKK